MYGFPELRDEPTQVAKPRIECFDYDNADCELRHVLLIAHSLIGGKEDVE
jgi:hypothetical protein